MACLTLKIIQDLEPRFAIYFHFLSNYEFEKETIIGHLFVNIVDHKSLYQQPMYCFGTSQNMDDFSVWTNNSRLRYADYRLILKGFFV